jgi:nucleotide-binding universal stress UspA family protein
MTDAASQPRFAAPPRRIAVGCDGSSGGADAVALAARLAAPGADFLLVDVAPRGTLARHLGEHRPADFSAARHALAIASPGSVETRTVRAESPAEVLADLAADERQDLIVVGSPHRGAVGRALIGSVARELVFRAAVPLAVAPHGYASRRRPAHRPSYAVGVDGSPESLAALAWAEALAATRAAELEVFTVAVPPSPIPGAPPAPGPREPFAPLELVVDRVGEEVESHAHLLVGQAAPNLAAAAAKADLLVIGTQVHKPFEKALLGSVSEDLVTGAECPVVALPVRSRPPHDRGTDPDGDPAAAAEDVPA